LIFDLDLDTAISPPGDLIQTCIFTFGKEVGKFFLDPVSVSVHVGNEKISKFMETQLAVLIAEDAGADGR